jgi:hypothetical protein
MGAAGTRGALRTRMNRALRLAAALALWPVGTGCSSTANQGASDAAAMTPDGQIDASACISADGLCVVTDAGRCPDGGIQASNYDQTCTIDSDCVAIAESKTCALCELSCASAAINVAEMSRYNSDSIALVTAAEEKCPSSCGDGPGGPCCMGGQCVVGLQCPFPVACCRADGDCSACPVDGGADASRNGGPADAGAE